jgi:outer membrane lipoprotein SlyB
MASRNFLIVVALFSLVLANTGYSGVVGDEIKGTVTKIDGVKVSIEDFMGDERTIEVKNPEALTDLKLGDRVTVKKGILIKDRGAGSSTPYPDLK